MLNHSLSVGHKRIAFLSGSPGSIFRYEKWQIWRGVAERARQLGYGLFYFAGEFFTGNPQAVVYDLIDPNKFDGVIFWNAFTSAHMEIDEVATYLRKFEPLPVVAVEREVPGGVSILVDNRQGVNDLLTHLSVDHGYRKIGFITDVNNQVAEHRRESFEGEMQRFGLGDSALVGTLAEFSARGLVPGEDFRALVVHTDYVAIEVIDELRRNGYRVPEDVAVVGFNDGQDARGAQPPLTTVRLPFRKMGRNAVERLSQLIDGASCDAVTVYPTYLITRRSCGCLEPLAEQAVVGGAGKRAVRFKEAVQQEKHSVVTAMSRGMAWNIDLLGWDWAEDIFDAVVSGLTPWGELRVVKDPAEVLQDVYDLLRRGVEEGINVSRWHDALTVLRSFIAPMLSGAELARAEDLFQQIRVLIGQTAMRSEVHRNWVSERRGIILRDIESALLISFDTHELLDILSRGLNRLGVDTFYLVTYENQIDPEGMGRLLLAYRDRKIENLPDDEMVFKLDTILPEHFLKGDQTVSLVIEPLHLREEQIGYIVFQTDPPAAVSECEIYEALRIQLSSALKGVRLRERLSEALKDAEDANQLKSRFLSMVSHELRTPLNLIVGLSEMAMRQQQKGGRVPQNVLRKYHEQIYISGQHLDRLIRDVLDLASSQVGQMKLTIKPFDLVPELREAGVMAAQLAEQKKLHFNAQIPDRLPVVRGDKTRIRQVLLNLLSNAVKFTAHGEVGLAAQPVEGGVRIVVHDTGLGIAPEEQQKIFNEFEQTTRSMGRGYAGIGLGLAITRRLVEMHGGTISVQSSGADGSGSSFEVFLPVLPDDQADIKAQENKREGKVVILTQTNGSSDRLVKHLSRQGFRVEELSLSRHEYYVDDWAHSPPGAVVLDLSPGSELGWDIVKRVKDNPATQDIPVLFYTLMAEEDSGSVVNLDYLTKPLGIEQLLDVLKRHGIKTGRRGPVSILIVDDEPGILEMHSQIVRTNLPDCRVITARDGVKALDCLRNNQVDLVLLDLLMPELDGFGVVKAMQAESSLREIPVIVLSAQVLTKREMQRLTQGVVGVLGKGMFSSAELFAKIESILGHNQRLGSEGQRLVFQAMGFIHEHYFEQISRADIAGHLNVNEQYLSRCFNRELGIGPMTYLSRYRIEQAKRLLEDGKMTITQVAMQVGLSSQSYFSRLFLQETGISPSAYQRGVRPTP